MYWRFSSCSAVGQGAVIRPAGGQSGIAQHALQHFVAELAVAGELDRGHGGPLLHDDHQHVALHLEAHVVEQAQAEQRADGGGALLVVVGLAHAHRQRGEDGARLHALQAFDADVAHGERVDRPGQLRGERHGHQRSHGPQAESLSDGFHECFERTAAARGR